MSRHDDDRAVDFSEGEPEILPDQTRDDTDEGWGEHRAARPAKRRGGRVLSEHDRRLLEDRPPHWG